MTGRGRYQAQLFGRGMMIKIWCEFEQSLVREARRSVSDGIVFGRKPFSGEREVQSAGQREEVA
jgi:hypothetical protein